MSTAEMQRESLSRAVSNQSTMNYSPIYAGFASKGIPEDQIRPRENVFTFNAWLALGRAVRKGEHGVKVVTWIVTRRKDKTGKEQTGKMCRTTTVFHISQTDPVPDQATRSSAMIASTI
jgi:antirestriction protein ArdC